MLWSSGETEAGISERSTTARGTGEFRLRFKIVKMGATHISFYPSGGGSSLGGVYFDNGAQAAESHPKTVSARRYRTWITPDIRSHSGGYWIEVLWFPEWKLEANAESESYDGPPTLNVFPAEFPHAHTKAGLAFIPTGGDPRAPYQGPIEPVEVPWELANRIRAAADLRAGYERERESVGPDLAASGLLRKVP
jgi:hypothetical protein